MTGQRRQLPGERLRGGALRVAIVADARYPIAEPFAGGLQSMTWHLARGLAARGVRVRVCAAPGSDPLLGIEELAVRPPRISAQARSDVSMPPGEWLEQHHAYLRLMLDLARRPDIDVVHNNSLHYLPVAMADALGVPMLTTLHTPPTPWLEPAIDQSTSRHSHFVAVSDYTAEQWRHVARVGVVPNGIDTDQWPRGPGGDDLVWFGRVVPEKGLHLALDIAERAGRRLVVAGPVADPAYWRERIQPRLGPRAHYAGHLRQAELARLVGRSAVALVTPDWDEPYGLVAAEALSCGTPVVGFARGGLPDVVDSHSARLVPAGDVDAAAAVLGEAEALDRAAVRGRAVSSCSIETMVDRYLELYTHLGAEQAA